MNTGNNHCSIHCILPPFLLETMAASKNPKVRAIALGNIAAAASFRSHRRVMSVMPTMAVNASPSQKKHRLVYDMAGASFPLPGALIRSEGGKASKDKAINEAYNHSGTTYDFYSKLFGRNSLDDNGMSLISSVHVADFNGGSMSNAFWDGTQMAYGDGDGIIFKAFTKSLDVVGHELTHGVVSFTSNLVYQDEPGALNEHYADVFG
ncbi:MAG: peptidase M4 family protein, partial [Prosthecobacter sp.]